MCTISELYLWQNLNNFVFHLNNINDCYDILSLESKDKKQHSLNLNGLIVTTEVTILCVPINKKNNKLRL